MSGYSLHRSVRERNYVDVTRLLSRGADVNAPDEVYHTPLEIAVENGDGVMVRMLADHGAEISGAPLVAAVYSGRADIAAFLLERGADPNRETGTTRPLWAAIERRDEEIMTLLLNSGATITGDGEEGQTVLEALIDLKWEGAAAQVARRLVDRATADTLGDSDVAHAVSVLSKVAGDNDEQFLSLLRAIYAKGLRLEGHASFECLIDEVFDRSIRLLQHFRPPAVASETMATPALLHDLVAFANANGEDEQLTDLAIELYDTGAGDCPLARAIVRALGPCSFSLFTGGNLRLIVDACGSDDEVFKSIRFWLREGDGLWRFDALDMIPSAKPGEEDWHAKEVLNVYELLFEVREDTFDVGEVRAYEPLIALGERAVPLLVQALDRHDMNDEHAEATCEALQALGEIGPAAHPVLDAVRQRLESTNPKVAAAAGEAIARIAEAN